MITGSVKCPECGAGFDIIDGKRINFCKYCGTVLEYDDGVVRTEHTERKIDETKIRELELQYQEDKEIRENSPDFFMTMVKYAVLFLGFLLAASVVMKIIEMMGV